MQITVTIPDEFVAWLKARGLEPRSYVQGMIDEAVRRDFADIPQTKPETNKE
jgi:hypothetical protein